MPWMAISEWSSMCAGLVLHVIAKIEHPSPKPSTPSTKPAKVEKGRKTLTGSKLASLALGVGQLS